MNILGYEISEKTQEKIKEFEKSFKKPLEYMDIAGLMIKGYGAVFYDDPSKYIVYLSTTLKNYDFETNLLCELHHIRQVEEQYPHTDLKRSDVVVKEKNPMFFQYLDHSLQSAIRDLDVMKRLKDSGYSIDFYISNRLQQIFDIDPKSNMTDKYNYASFGVQFILFCLTAKEDEIVQAKDFLNKNFNNIANEIYPMAEKVKETGFSDADECAKSILYLIDSFNLWDIMYFMYGDLKIKTHNSYIRYIEENM